MSFRAFYKLKLALSYAWQPKKILSTINCNSHSNSWVPMSFVENKFVTDCVYKFHVTMKKKKTENRNDAGPKIYFMHNLCAYSLRCENLWATNLFANVAHRFVISVLGNHRFHIVRVQRQTCSNHTCDGNKGWVLFRLHYHFAWSCSNGRKMKTFLKYYIIV